MSDPSGENLKKKVTFKENKGQYIKNIFKSIGKFIWNPKTKEFLGRDGESWSKFFKNEFYHEFSLFFIISF